LVRASWPGRLQQVARAPRVFLDGAHNPQGAGALARSLREMLPGIGEGQERSVGVELVFAALADKDIAELLAPLLPLAKSIHLCAVHSPRALAVEPLRAQVAALAPGLSSRAYGSAREALRGAIQAAGLAGVVVCCGSLYLVGELLAAVGARELELMPSELLQPRV
jgi:dihydrofolate synthase/folylpolyglutamate synthase